VAVPDAPACGRRGGGGRQHGRGAAEVPRRRGAGGGGGGGHGWCLGSWDLGGVVAENVVGGNSRDTRRAHGPSCFITVTLMRSRKIGECNHGRQMADRRCGWKRNACHGHVISRVTSREYLYTCISILAGKIFFKENNYF
jgi:hypothetical protein